MSLRTFTVFQDAESSEIAPPKVARPNAMVTRSSTQNVPGATLSADPLDKENYHPVTGERAGPSNSENKKRKTSVLATKVQPPSAAKSKKEKDPQPELKKRKASTSTVGTTKAKVAKKDGKGSASLRKGSKRASSRRHSPLPRLNEEEDPENGAISQSDVDSRCYELTVKPLADVSEAYEDFSVFGGASATANVSEEKVKSRTLKVRSIFSSIFNSPLTHVFHLQASSAEPEIRDYFEPSQTLFSSRRRALSEDAPEPRAFSTPERKQIYAAFTFSSPSGSSARFSKASGSGDISPAEQLA